MAVTEEKIPVHVQTFSRQPLSRSMRRCVPPESLHQATSINCLGLAEGHGHAERLKTVERRAHQARRGSYNAGRSRAVQRRVKRRCGITRIRHGRRVFDRTGILSGEFLFVVSTLAESVRAVAPVVCPLMPKKFDRISLPVPITVRLRDRAGVLCCGGGVWRADLCESR